MGGSSHAVKKTTMTYERTGRTKRCRRYCFEKCLKQRFCSSTETMFLKQFETLFSASTVSQDQHCFSHQNAPTRRFSRLSGSVEPRTRMAGRGCGGTLREHLLHERRALLRDAVHVGPLGLQELHAVPPENVLHCAAPAAEKTPLQHPFHTTYSVEHPDKPPSKTH